MPAIGYTLIIAALALFFITDVDAKHREGTQPDYISCELVFNEHKYAKERVMRTMHAFDIDDPRDMHNLARDCRMHAVHDYWKIYRGNPTLYNVVLIEDMLEWRRNNDKEEFDDSTPGKIIKFLIK